MIDIESKKGIFRLTYALISLGIIIGIISIIFYFTISSFIEDNPTEDALVGALVGIFFSLVFGVAIYGLDIVLYHVFKRIVEDKSNCGSLYVLIAKIIENNIKE